MFGHNSNDQASAVQHGSDTPTASSIPSLEPETIAPTAASPSPAPTSAPVVDNPVDEGAIGSYVGTDLPGTTTAPTTPSNPNLATEPAPIAEPGMPVIGPAAADPVAASAPTLPSLPETPNVSTPTPVAPTAVDAGDSAELLELKQSALHELSPLLGHLDQTPEEKFRTTMMMIQASDDHTMLQTAYEAAKAITDEKARAQALLDVVNEINYFTQPPANDASAA